MADFLLIGSVRKRACEFLGTLQGGVPERQDPVAVLRDKRGAEPEWMRAERRQRTLVSRCSHKMAVFVGVAGSERAGSDA